MLRRLTRTVLVLATLATGALGVTAVGSTPAAAGSLQVGVTIGGPAVHYVDDRRGRDRGHARRADVCNPRQALRKADRLGVNRARLVRVNRRAVVVEGRSRGDHVRVRFAQARGCPVIGYR